MVYFRYIREVIGIIDDSIIILELEDEKHLFNKPIFISAFFIFTTVFMPLLAFYILTVDRGIVLKDLSSSILASYFKLDKK